MKKKTLLFLALLITVPLLSACAFLPKATPSTPSVDPAATEQLSAWVVYWDADNAASEIAALGGKLESLLYFGAYFDAQNQLFIPDEIVKLKEQFGRADGKTPPRPCYLTFINDKLLPGGGSSLKDTELLYMLLETPEARQAHIQNILALTKDGGYDGIEIDYEAIRQDMVLWGHFIDFITELSAAAQQDDLLLRVLLEPGIPYESLRFPKGPDYVIMCYNLHGPGSAPGPKADDAFLLELIKKTAELPGRRHFALATGGFDWTDKATKALSGGEAHALARREKANQLRDPGSQAISFSYRQADGLHEVWYADSITLTHWMSLIRNAGDFGISLWRLCE